MFSYFNLPYVNCHRHVYKCAPHEVSSDYLLPFFNKHTKIRTPEQIEILKINIKCHQFSKSKCFNLNYLISIKLSILTFLQKFIKLFIDEEFGDYVWCFDLNSFVFLKKKKYPARDLLACNKMFDWGMYTSRLRMTTWKLNFEPFRHRSFLMIGSLHIYLCGSLYIYLCW